ncbi:MAG: GNAT family N-acetyltransferase [Methanomassiliicoccales archaeon]|nr:GNAT family N-acetyltransferase [Methanomassiliicoccales archaeon]
MDRPDVKIVPVGPENADGLLSLITELAMFEKLEPPTAEAKERMRHHITSSPPLFYAFLATIEGVPVGYITYYFTYSTFLAAPTFFLEDIFVQEMHRRSGVGRSLFRYCMKEAVEKGCGRMEWCALNWNVKAMDFYVAQGGKKLGWTFFRMDRGDMERSLS